jgi:alpha-tubulin suppressor-like RCC1 family protein
LALRGGILYSWGRNNFGETGLGTSTGNTTTPTQVGSFTDWSKISVVNLVAFGARNGTLYSWGRNNNAATGLGFATETLTLTPTQVGSFTDWSEVSGGSGFGFAIRNGALYSWGLNTGGRNGQGLTTGNTLAPTRIGLSNNWITVSGNTSHGAGIQN